MTFFRLAFKSLLSRRLATVLTALSIALSVALLLSVERLRRSAEEGFTSAISKTDLIVGARGGSLQLILYTVFNMGGATNNVSWDSYQEWKKNPAVDWTIPYSLGDGHRGFRTVATDGNFFEHYRFRGDRAPEFAGGRVFEGVYDAVLGADVARKLNYAVGQRVVIAHGSTTGDSFQDHADKPFVVSGILKPTGTPIDRSIYISLAAMEAIHRDGDVTGKDLTPSAITAFFLRAKSRIAVLNLQREINTFAKEPMLAIIPGATLQDLWRNLGYVEQVLRVVSLLVVLVGLASMIIALTTTLNERRREMAILRSLGAGGSRILGLLVFEAGLLSGAGVIAGWLLHVVGFALIAPWLEREFGLFLVGAVMSGKEISMLAAVWACGLAAGFIPAWRAQRQALKDGLS